MKLTRVQIVIICGLALFVLVIGLIVSPPNLKSEDQTPLTGAPSMPERSIQASKEPAKALILSPERFEEKRHLKTDKKTKIQNSLNYLIHSPQKPWPKGIKFPVIIHLRDNNDTAFSAEYITQDQMAYHFPAFSIVPDLRNQFRGALSKDYNNLPDLKFAHERYQEERDTVDYKKLREDSALVTKPILALLDDLESELPIDKSQIYLIGCGYGGATAFSLIEARPQKFASAVIINSAWDTQTQNKLTKTPILMLNGKKNGVFSSFIAQSLSNQINKSGGKTIFQAYDSMPHTCSYKSLYSNKMWKWMFAQSRQ